MVLLGSMKTYCSFMNEDGPVENGRHGIITFGRKPRRGRKRVRLNRRLFGGRKSRQILKETTLSLGGYRWKVELCCM